MLRERLEAEARRVERQALRGRTRHFSGLSAEEGEPKLGPLASSKWVPEDHPEGHKECPLAPEDCDEDSAGGGGGSPGALGPGPEPLGHGGNV